jgi:hypothetical protein
MLARIRAWYLDLHGMTKLALLLIGGAYVASFFMPVASVFSIDDPILGWRACLAVGVMPFTSDFYAGHKMLDSFDEIAQERGALDWDARIHYLLLWFANPLFWAGLVAMVREKGAWVSAAGLLAFVFGLSASIITAETKLRLETYDYGYYAWLLSMLTMAFFGIWLMVAQPRKYSEPLNQ